MRFQVFYTDRVTAEIAARIDSLREEHAGDRVIERWFGELFEAIDGLSEMPTRFVVDYAESEKRGYTVRKLVFRDYIVRYRVYAALRRVVVMSFMHGARRRSGR